MRFRSLKGCGHAILVGRFHGCCHRRYHERDLGKRGGGGVGCVGLSWQMVFKQDLVGVPRRYVLPSGSLRVQVVRLRAHSELGKAL